MFNFIWSSAPNSQLSAKGVFKPVAINEKNEREPYSFMDSENDDEEDIYGTFEYGEERIRPLNVIHHSVAKKYVIGTLRDSDSGMLLASAMDDDKGNPLPQADSLQLLHQLLSTVADNFPSIKYFVSGNSSMCNADVFAEVKNQGKHLIVRAPSDCQIANEFLAQIPQLKDLLQPLEQHSDRQAAICGYMKRGKLYDTPVNMLLVTPKMDEVSYSTRS